MNFSFQYDLFSAFFKDKQLSGVLSNISNIHLLWCLFMNMLPANSPITLIHFSFSLFSPSRASICRKICSHMSACWRIKWNVDFCQAIDPTFPILRSPTHSQNTRNVAFRAQNHEHSKFHYMFPKFQLIWKTWPEFSWYTLVILTELAQLTTTCYPMTTSNCMMSSTRKYEWLFSTAF